LSQAATNQPTSGAPSTGARESRWGIAADIDALAGLTSEFEHAGTRAGIPHPVMFRLLLILEEVVTNAIKYGYTDGRPGHIDIALRVAPGRIAVEVTDDGDPFDPTAGLAPIGDQPIEERPIGGLGLHLIRKLSDGLAYQRRDCRNVLTIDKHFDAAAASTER
jgi:serine/threonine-protein kinase RsbW